MTAIINRGYTLRMSVPPSPANANSHGIPCKDRHACPLLMDRSERPTQRTWLCIHRICAFSCGLRKQPKDICPSGEVHP